MREKNSGTSWQINLHCCSFCICLYFVNKNSNFFVQMYVNVLVVQVDVLKLCCTVYFTKAALQQTSMVTYNNALIRQSAAQNKIRTSTLSNHFKLQCENDTIIFSTDHWILSNLHWNHVNLLTLLYATIALTVYLSFNINGFFSPHHILSVIYLIAYLKSLSIESLVWTRWKDLFL